MAVPKKTIKRSSLEKDANQSKDKLVVGLAVIFTILCLIFTGIAYFSDL